MTDLVALQRSNDQRFVIRVAVPQAWRDALQAVALAPLVPALAWLVLQILVSAAVAVVPMPGRPPLVEMAGPA